MRNAGKPLSGGHRMTGREGYPNWGQVGAGEPLWAPLTDKDDGPPSPAHRLGAGANIYGNPVEFHNNVLSDGCPSVPTQ